MVEKDHEQLTASSWPIDQTDQTRRDCGRSGLAHRLMVMCMLLCKSRSFKNRLSIHDECDSEESSMFLPN